MRSRILTVAVWLCVYGAHLGAADKSLTNDDVVALTKAGFDDATIVAKINQSGREALDTSVDGLIRLKKAGVTKAVLDAMLGAPSTVKTTKAAAPAPKSDVQLLTSDGNTLDLHSLVGESSATYIGIGFMTWLNFAESRSSTRTTDPNLRLRIRESQKPESRWFIVRLDSNDSDRSVKMGKAGMFSMSAGTTPDRDWTFQYAAEEESDGTWSLTPRKPLVKGEYGLLHGNELYDFAVD